MLGSVCGRKAVQTKKTQRERDDEMKLRTQIRQGHGRVHSYVNLTKVNHSLLDDMREPGDAERNRGGDGDGDGDGDGGGDGNSNGQ